jgi:hypothetical protein
VVGPHYKINSIPNQAENTTRIDCTDFVRNCTSSRALFRVQVPMTGKLPITVHEKVIDLIGVYGGRTRDRTLDLSRVKGTLSR